MAVPRQIGRDDVQAMSAGGVVVVDAVVVSPGGVVLGILGPKALVVSSTARVEEAMRPGPSTYRPDVPVQELLAKLAPRQVRRALVATPEGRLLGIFYTDDVPGT